MNRDLKKFLNSQELSDFEKVRFLTLKGALALGLVICDVCKISKSGMSRKAQFYAPNRDGIYTLLDFEFLKKIGFSFSESEIKENAQKYNGCGYSVADYASDFFVNRIFFTHYPDLKIKHGGMGRTCSALHGGANLVNEISFYQSSDDMAKFKEIFAPLKACDSADEIESLSKGLEYFLAHFND